jgi:hypothetical protein
MKTKILQILIPGVKTLGFNPGLADGLDGRKTQAALDKSAASRFGSSAKAISGSVDGYPPRPEASAAGKAKVFGPAGVKGGKGPSMELFPPPYPMEFSWGGPVSKMGCHKMLVPPIQNALNEIKDTFGLAWIKKHGLDDYAGCYSPRKSRGGNSISDHSWAIAFDFAADRKGNGNRDQWRANVEGRNGVAMPNEAVAIFRKHGFQVGFQVSSGVRRDMMHVAYVNRP